MAFLTQSSGKLAEQALFSRFSFPFPRFSDTIGPNESRFWLWKLTHFPNEFPLTDITPKEDTLPMLQPGISAAAHGLGGELVGHDELDFGGNSRL